MLSIVASGTLIGIRAHPIHVEVNEGEIGDPRLILVGLPDAAVKESQDRVASAITNSGFSMPTTRTTINLAPGNIRKEGPFYDLPIALGILAATYQLSCDCLQDYIIAGELSLSGETRPVKGALALALLAREQGKKGVLLPPASAEEAALLEDVPVYPISSLDEAVLFLKGEKNVEALDARHSVFTKPPAESYAVDFEEVKGQPALRRAVEVAVAGGHNLLMIGPPGSGKSMIAKRIPTIIPEPQLDEFLEILSIQSAAGMSLSEENRCFKRPFRAPHHSISDVGLLGGGNPPGPGEISLAHEGVLFLDELPEFKRSALEVMRQPLEDREASISRSMGKVTFPCSIMLVAAMNPCPCGYLTEPKRECRCSPTQIQRYRARISGPLLDRIDIHIDAPALTLQELRTAEEGESSESMRGRIQKARELQKKRLPKEGYNARMNPRHLKEHCKLDKEQGLLLEKAMEDLNLSARAYTRVLKVARTIADLENKDEIETPHLLEAIQYRSLDRNVFY